MNGIAKTVISGLIGLIGLIALFFAAKAQAGGMYYGGLLIFAIAVGYIYWQIKRTMDAYDQSGHGDQNAGHV